MRAVQVAIHARLAADAEIAAGIGSYKGVPAIFTRKPVPGNAPARRITISGGISDEPYDTKDVGGRDLLTDITVWTEEAGDPRLVESLAERVRALFHGRPLEIPGYGNLIAIAGGPIENDGDQILGRVVTVRHTLMQLS